MKKKLTNNNFSKEVKQPDSKKFGKKCFQTTVIDSRETFTMIFKKNNYTVFLENNLFLEIGT